jgi:hypothetical protein
VTEWPTIANTLISLIAGGGIAIAGQALADRRAGRREREARREDYKISSFAAQREALMKVQDIAARISGELSAEHSRQDKTGERFAPKTPETIDRQLSEIDALFRQLVPVAEQTNIVKSKEEEGSLEGEAERISANALGVTMNLVGDFKAMERIVKKQVEFLSFKLNPLIRELENNVIRAASPPVATAAREYLEAARDYNYGFDPDVTRFKREQAARDRLQISVGEALKAGPFVDQE